MSGNWFDALVDSCNRSKDKPSKDIPVYEGIEIIKTRKSDKGLLVEYNKTNKDKAFVYIILFVVSEDGRLTVSYRIESNSRIGSDAELMNALWENVNRHILAYKTDTPGLRYPALNIVSMDCQKLMEKKLLSLLVFYDVTNSYDSKDLTYVDFMYKYPILRYDNANLFRGFQFSSQGLLTPIKNVHGDLAIVDMIQTHKHWLISYRKFTEDTEENPGTYVLALDHTTMDAVNAKEMQSDVMSEKEFLQILELNTHYELQQTFFYERD